MNDPELQDVIESLREYGDDFTALMKATAAMGFCPVFVAIRIDGTPALVFGVWQGVPLDHSDDPHERAAAALIYGDWTTGCPLP